MTKFQCECCGWEGTEPRVIVVSNPSDPDDATLYEGIVCPECEEYCLSESEDE